MATSLGEAKCAHVDKYIYNEKDQNISLAKVVRPSPCEYLLIAIIPGSTLTRSGRTCWVSSMGQTDFFLNYDNKIKIFDTIKSFVNYLLKD